MTTTEAPPIKGRYPLAGERIGPAWRLMWALLGQTDGYVVGADWCEDLAPGLDLHPKTLLNLLLSAAQVGLVERKYEVVARPGGGTRRMGCYRRTDVPRATSTRDAGGR